MSTFKSTLVLGLLLLANACSVGTVTASTRMASGGGGGGAAGLGGIHEASSPRNVEPPSFDRPVIVREANVARENPAFRIEQDCWRCR